MSECICRHCPHHGEDGFNPVSLARLTQERDEARQVAEAVAQAHATVSQDRDVYRAQADALSDWVDAASEVLTAAGYLGWINGKSVTLADRVRALIGHCDEARQEIEALKGWKAQILALQEAADNKLRPLLKDEPGALGRHIYDVAAEMIERLQYAADELEYVKTGEWPSRT